MAIQPEQFFTPINIVSAGVATLAVNVAANALYRLLRLPAAWTAFGAALVIAYLVVAMQTAPPWHEWVLAFFNACLLFCSAQGVNEVGVAATKRPGSGFADARPLFEPWLRR